MKLIWAYNRFTELFSKIFSTKLNPFYHLGSISVFLLIVATVSGIYLFFFYDIDPSQAYISTELISQQFIGNLMRGVHRYSSDAFIIFILFHFFHMLITGKFKRVLSWISGVISVGLVWIIGLTGFILVWDNKAKLIGLLTSKLLVYLPIFDPSIAGAFLMNDLNFLSGLFRVTLFAHIFLTLGMAVLIWIHVIRVGKPKLIPPKYWMWLLSIILIVISFLFPVASDAPAQTSIVPYDTTFDWYYFAGYYFIKLFSIPINWIIIITTTLLFIGLPYIFRKKKITPAVINQDICDGCTQCEDDCPYEAIDMKMINGKEKAVVDPNKCESCGICLGSCKDQAISISLFPDLSSGWEKEKKDLVIFNCIMTNGKSLPNNTNIRNFIVPCVGDLNTKEVEKLIEDKTEGILLVSCDSCFHRLGTIWEQERLNHNRRPTLRRSVDPNRIKLIKGSHNIEQESKKLIDLIKDKEGSNLKQIHIKEYAKKLPIIPEIIILILFIIIPFISTPTINFYNKNENLVILNLKYNSSPVVETITAESGLNHMQSSIPIVKRRSPIKIEVTDFVSGKQLYVETIKAGGWREDIAISLYKEIYVNNPISVKLTETEFPDKVLQIDNIKPQSNDATIIGLKYDKLSIIQSNSN